MVSTSTSQAAQKIVVVGGGGRVGRAVMDLLATDARYDPFAIETDYAKVRALREDGLAGEHLSGTDQHGLEPHLRDAACVICAAPPSVSVPLARAARAYGCHYVDVCEDIALTETVNAVAEGAETCFAPGSGLAPGLVTAMIDRMIREGGPGADITAYVGVLPAEKTNRLGYGNIWGVDGLVAEYTHPTQALQMGAVVEQPPLAGYETITLNGQDYEAFTTSGSLETLVRHHAGGIRGLQFKTLRFRGHLDYIRFLLDDLKLSQRLYMFRNLLMNGLDDVERDRVIIHIVDRGAETPREITHAFEATPLPDGATQSAVSAVTARHACAVMEVLTQGLAPKKGVLHHHDLTLDVLATTRFGEDFRFDG